MELAKNQTTAASPLPMQVSGRRNPSFQAREDSKASQFSSNSVVVKPALEEIQGEDLLQLKAELLWACAVGAELSAGRILRSRPSLATIAVDNRGCRPLHFACASGNLSLVQSLCGPPHWANTLKREQGNCKYSPIEIAAVHGHVCIVEYLANFHGALDEPGALKGWPAWDKFLQHRPEAGSTGLSPCLEKDPCHHTLPARTLETVAEGREQVRQFLMHQFGIGEPPDWGSEEGEFALNSEGSAWKGFPPRDFKRNKVYKFGNARSFSTDTESTACPTSGITNSRLQSKSPSTLRERRGLSLIAVSTSTVRNDDELDKVVPFRSKSAPAIHANSERNTKPENIEKPARSEKKYCTFAISRLFIQKK